MAQPDFTSGQLGLTPRKLALIGFLGIVLTVVVIMQVGPDPSSESSASPRRATAARAPRPGRPLPSESAAADATATPERPRLVWPQIARQEIEQYDPFAAPAALFVKQRDGGGETDRPSEEEEEPADQASRLARQQFLAALQEQGVSLIVKSGGDKIAYIGSLVLHVGDEVQGLRVTDIRPDGVFLEEAGGWPR